MRDSDALSRTDPGVRGALHSLLQSLEEAAQRTRRFCWTNPRDLVRFARRLGGALLAANWWSVIGPRAGVMGQIPRTFFRGVGPVVLLGVAVGLGLGVIADRFGVVLLPLVEETFVLAMVRDGMPLILALLVTARTGASVAARLGDNRQTRFEHGRASSRELVRSTVPHLVAGAVTAWLFYRIATALLLSGYQSGGNIEDLLTEALAGNAFPVDRELDLSRSASDGGAKAALFGFIVAYVSSAFGITTNEGRYASDEERAIALQDAVWESGVTSIVLCLLAAIVWWNVRGGME